MPGHFLQHGAGLIIEDQHLASSGRVARVHLAQVLDHHVVGGLVDEGDHRRLTVDKVVAVFALGQGCLGHLPHEVPGQHLGQGVTQLLHKGLVDVAHFSGAHVGHGVGMSRQLTLRQVFGDHLAEGGRVKADVPPAQAVVGVGE